MKARKTDFGAWFPPVGVVVGVLSGNAPFVLEARSRAFPPPKAGVAPPFEGGGEARVLFLLLQPASAGLPWFGLEPPRISQHHADETAKERLERRVGPGRGGKRLKPSPSLVSPLKRAKEKNGLPTAPTPPSRAGLIPPSAGRRPLKGPTGGSSPARRIHQDATNQEPRCILCPCAEIRVKVSRFEPRRFAERPPARGGFFEPCPFSQCFEYETRVNVHKPRHGPCGPCETRREAHREGTETVVCPMR